MGILRDLQAPGVLGGDRRRKTLIWLPVRPKLVLGTPGPKPDMESNLPIGKRKTLIICEIKYLGLAIYDCDNFWSPHNIQNTGVQILSFKRLTLHHFLDSKWEAPLDCYKHHFQKV